MSFKQSMGLSRASWLDIGTHLGEVVKKVMARTGRTHFDLTNHIRRFNNTHIEPDYVLDYMDGKASFGCFYPLVEDFLQIPPQEVFTKGGQQSMQKDRKELWKYLGTLDNLESFLPFLTVRPGIELRKHIAKVLTGYREKEVAGKPYIAMELGLNPEEETNPYLDKKRALLDFIRAQSLALQGRSLQLLPSSSLEAKAEECAGSEIIRMDRNQLYQKLASDIIEIHSTSGQRAEPIIPGSKIVVQEANLRGRRGFSVDVFYPEEYVDRFIAGETKENDGIPDEWKIGLENWRRAYREGDLSGINDMQSISNLGVCGFNYTCKRANFC